MPERSQNAISGGHFEGPVFLAENLSLNRVGAAEMPEPGDGDAWVLAAGESAVWKCVHSSRDATRLRRQVHSVVQRLADLRDGLDPELRADPWHDAGMAERFAERIAMLLVDEGDSLDLFPSEAALLVLIPFLYRVIWLRAVAAAYPTLAPIESWTAAESALGMAAEKQDFAAFASQYEALVNRARLRPEARASINWWLLHRWLLKKNAHADSKAVRRLVEDIVAAPSGIGGLLSSPHLETVLSSLRRGPNLVNDEFLASLPADEGVRSAPGERIRYQRIALIAALAYATCLDMTALPETIVEHVGIPHPVDLGQLRETVEHAGWAGPAGLPVLRAECGHAAVATGLVQYMERADETLRAVQRAKRGRLNHPLPALPERYSHDEVRPAEGVFDAWAEFRTDDRRIRDLLSSAIFYRDRDFAVRELYQNALDACRYRRARSAYLTYCGPGEYLYKGGIAFTQAVDADGRAYLECRDDGIGMGKSELRELFCKAGSRFAEHSDFVQERVKWAEAGLPEAFTPNSRFGIGVFSYFMLADEMSVLTCRMGPDGRPGPECEAKIFGPKSLFEIVERWNPQARPGTTVRLYLRDPGDPEEPWSGADALERILGLAEFATSATDGDRRVEWAAGEMAVRKQPEGERFGFEAHGERFTWRQAPEGVDLVWTEHGGGLLVDGLIVQPAVREGVLSSSDSGLTGVVVNLSGSYVPDRLSADRTLVLDDLAPSLRELLGAAAEDLVRAEHPLPSFPWICQIADGSIALADMLTQVTARAARHVKYQSSSVDVVRAGILPSDAEQGVIVQHVMHNDMGVPWHFAGDPPLRILLWRLLAHGPSRLLSQLTALCPEICDAGPILPALPSDQLLLSREGDQYWHWTRPYSHIDDFCDAVQRSGCAPRTAARRAALLGVHDLDPDGFPVSPRRLRTELLVVETRERKGFVSRSHVPTSAELLDLSRRMGRAPSDIAAAQRGYGLSVPEDAVALATAAQSDPFLSCVAASENLEEWFAPGGTVPLGCIAQTSLEQGSPVAEVCARFREHGLAADPWGLSECPDSDTALLLRAHGRAGGEWLEMSETISPAQILNLAKEQRCEPLTILHRYRALGFRTPEPFPLDASIEDLETYGNALYLTPPGPVFYADVFCSYPFRPAAEVIEGLEKYGFDIPVGWLNARDRSIPPLPEELFETAWDDELPLGDPVPFGWIIDLARNSHHDAQDLMRNLDEWGIRPTRTDYPEGLTVRSAYRVLQLLDGPISFNENPAELIKRLLECAHGLETSVGQVVAWLRELGFPAPDVRGDLLKALAAVPRPDASEPPFLL